MEAAVKRYYQLKQQHKEIEQELAGLRSAITAYCAEKGTTELAAGDYRAKIIFQDRREYDDNKLYDVLPETGMWRMVSKADSAKVASLIKLNVLSEDYIKNAYTIKVVTVLQVDKM